MIHELKIKPEYFAAVVSGDKTFENRNNADRNFQVGDTLLLWEWNEGFTSQTVERTVSYITDFEQKPGYVVLGLANKREKELAEQLADATRQCGVMADLLRDSQRYVRYHLEHTECDARIVMGLISDIDSMLAGKIPHPAVTVTETIRTAPERIWLQVGDQGHYHSEPFPSNTSEVTWCADSVVACEVPYVRADLVGKHPDAWLPIETAPRDGRKALVYRPLAENSGDERIAVKRLTSGRSNNCWDKTVPPGETPCNPTDGACHVTHWMPLPDEPAQQGGAPCDSASPSSSPD